MITVISYQPLNYWFRNYNHMTATWHFPRRTKRPHQPNPRCMVTEGDDKHESTKEEAEECRGSLLWSNHWETISRTAAITLLCCSISFMLMQ